jgi:hypothetical protein
VGSVVPHKGWNGEASGKTNLMRMQQTACWRGAHSERANYSGRRGLLKVPDASALLRRNDYAGIVRLIDVIQTEAAMFDRLKGGMCAPRSRGRPHGEGRCLRHLIRLGWTGLQLMQHSEAPRIVAQGRP